MKERIEVRLIIALQKKKKSLSYRIPVYKSVELLHNNSLFIPIPKDVYTLLRLNHHFVRIMGIDDY